MLALAPPDLSGANARVDARPSMKDEALPHCGSDGERRGRAADAAAGPVLARPNFFRTCLPPRDVVDRATERLNPPRFRAICTVAYRSPPAQDCLTSRRSLVRAQYRPSGNSRRSSEVELLARAYSRRVAVPWRAAMSTPSARLVEELPDADARAARRWVAEIRSIEACRKARGCLVGHHGFRSASASATFSAFSASA